MRWIDRWKERARYLTREVYALYWACRHPRAPWYAKVFVAGLVAYAFSPIDLVPDFIPVLGISTSWFCCRSGWRSPSR